MLKLDGSGRLILRGAIVVSALALLAPLGAQTQTPYEVAAAKDVMLTLLQLLASRAGATVPS